MKNIELDELDPTLYVFNHLLSILFLILNSSRERIKRLNDFKIRLDRVGSFFRDVEQVRTVANSQPFTTSTSNLPQRLQSPNVKYLLQFY